MSLSDTATNVRSVVSRTPCSGQEETTHKFSRIVFDIAQHALGILTQESGWCTGHRHRDRVPGREEVLQYVAELACAPAQARR